jgi:hypothetical protein
MEVSSEQSRLKILKSQIAVLHTDFIFDAKDLAIAHAESPPTRRSQKNLKPPLQLMSKFEQ